MLSLLRYVVPGRFHRALEADYQADLADEKLSAFCRSSILCSILYAAFGLLDLVALPSNVGKVWIVRALVIGSTVLATIAARRRRDFFLRHYSLFACALYFWWGIGIDVIILLSSPDDPARDSYYAGLILVSMALYSWTYLNPVSAALTGLALALIYTAMSLFAQQMWQGHDWIVVLQNCFFLISANAVGAFSLYIRERFSRRAFLLKSALTNNLRLEEEAKRQNKHLSEHDPLTGLPNRLRFLRKLGEMIELRAHAESVAVLFLDLDGFKAINDEHGHAAGDEVLRCVADRVRAAIRATDLAGRLGGDEFVVALPLGDSHGPAIIERISGVLRGAISQPVDFQGISLRISSSIGAAVFPEHGETAEELLHVADQGMYQAKRRRRDARVA